MAAGPSIPTSTTQIVARAMKPSMMSSTTATRPTDSWHMAPLLAAQALMTSASLAFSRTCQRFDADLHKVLRCSNEC